jgi:hypothetical protein
MSSSKLMSWSGLAALIGGVLLIIFNLLDLVVLGGKTDSATVMSGNWIFVEIGYIVAEVLISLGLIGLYARQEKPAGTQGLVAFLVAFTGTVLMTGADWSAAFLGPSVAEAAPELVNGEPTGIASVGFLVSVLLFVLGWFLFGWASYQARIQSRSASIIMMVGALLALVFFFIELPLEVVFLGIALVWMGYTQWNSATESPSLKEAAAI